jgi:hypothetical protein
MWDGIKSRAGQATFSGV